MKKKTSFELPAVAENDMRSEYDFSDGVRGKHYKDRLKGYTLEIQKQDGTTLVKSIEREGVVALEPDVQAYFPDSEAVNHALRTLITLFPEQRKGTSRLKNGRKPASKSRAKELV
jgi:hypothetical protein